jgi:dihydrofolate synthase/folylpolyglutamate synthase
LDATNVCHPRVSVITSISFDHTQQLGNTLAAIAAEKAGIIKPGVPVVSSVADQEPREVIRQTAWRHGCRLTELGVDFDFQYRPPRGPEAGPGLAGVDFRWLRDKGDSGHLCGQTRAPPPSSHQGYRDLPLRLWGRHQAANAATALAALGELEAAGWSVPEAAVRTGLAQVVWPARMEQLGRRPAVVVDGAHNLASIEALLRTLDESFPARRRRLIFAVSHDKDYAAMLQRVLPRFDQVFLTRYLTNPRAVPPEELAALAGAGRDLREDGRCRVFATPAEAWAEARRHSGPEDLICVAGSLFLAAELRQLILNPPSTHCPNTVADQA